MFKELTALMRDKHQDLQFAPAAGYAFAAGLMVSPVMTVEAALAARDMPIVFSKGDGMPIALLGLKPGHNAYVGAKGNWLARYIPAHVRRYPFMLAEQQVEGQSAGTGKRTFTLMADLAAPHFAARSGERLFDGQGQPTETLKKIEKVLMDLQRAHVHTQQCVQQILETGILVDRTLKAQTSQGKTLGLDGMKLVDAEKFNQLPAEKLAALKQTGALGLIYAHLMSMSNLNEAPLRLAEDLAPKPPASLVGDTLPLSVLS